MRKDWDDGQAYVAELLGSLKRKPWAELAQLPGYVELAPPTGLGRSKFGQWKDTRPDRSLRIVVQQYRPGVLAGRMAADGFVVYPDGRLAEIPPDEMWQYT